jgi:hypothetical protein
MEQPMSFVHPTMPTYVYRLQKYLYGLKQAPWAWYTRLRDFLLSIGFKDSKVDTFLFIFLWVVIFVIFLSILMKFYSLVVTLLWFNVSLLY